MSPGDPPSMSPGTPPRCPQSPAVTPGGGGGQWDPKIQWGGELWGSGGVWGYRREPGGGVWVPGGVREGLRVFGKYKGVSGSVLGCRGGLGWFGGTGGSREGFGGAGGIGGVWGAEGGPREVSGCDLGGHGVSPGKFWGAGWSRRALGAQFGVPGEIFGVQFLGGTGVVPGKFGRHRGGGQRGGPGGAFRARFGIPGTLRGPIRDRSTPETPDSPGGISGPPPPTPSPLHQHPAKPF